MRSLFSHWRPSTRRGIDQPDHTARVCDLANAFVGQFESDPKSVGPLIRDYEYLAAVTVKALYPAAALDQRRRTSTLIRMVVDPAATAVNGNYVIGHSQMTPPDWAAIADKLLADTRAAFDRFVERHPGETCSHVQYDCDPGNGHMSLGFDTPAASLAAARRHQESSLPHMRDMLGGATWQRDAHRFLKDHSLLPVNLGVESVAYPQEVFWAFPEWVEFAMSDDYPQRVRQGAYVGDDYLEAAVALCVWRVVEGLEAEDAFARLPMSRPCVVSYWHHDDDVAIIRVLNWPAVRAPC